MSRQLSRRPVSPGAGIATAAAAIPAQWFELFYDLVLVAAALVLSNAYSQDASWDNAAWLAGMFAVLWWVWLSTTELTNRDRTDSLSRRAVLLLQMFVITIFTMVGANAVEFHAGWSVAIAGTLLLTVAVLAEEIRRTVPELARMACIRRNAFALGGVLAIVGVILPGVGSAVTWSLAATVLVVAGLATRYDDPKARSLADTHHLVERFGLFTMIVLGESFVKVALTASTITLSSINFLVLALEFLIIFALWLSYFDDVTPVGPPAGPASRKAWFVAHLPLHLAIVAMAAGLARWETVKVSSHLTLLDVRLFTLPLAVIYAALAVVGMVAPRRPRVPVVALRLGTAVLVVVVGLLAWKVEWVRVDVAAGLYVVVALGYAVATEWQTRRRPEAPSPL